MSRPTPGDLAQLARGFLMGSADIVPGVSGGTVALILGIYQRLIAAISHFDRRLLGLLAARRWRDAAAHVDLRFLATLGMGILTGVASLATLMQYLLDQQRSYTLAVFFGLILASSVVVARMVRPTRLSHALICILGSLAAAALAFWIVNLDQLQSPPDHLGYFFFCGVVAICAMILPGVSGAFLLLMLGVYDDVTDVIKSLLHLDVSSRELLTLGVFCCGCAVGLIGFAKLLRRLLESAHAITMAVLCGFMIGSLWRLWPFQLARNPESELKHRVYDNVAPADVSAIFWQFIAPALTAFSLVLAIEWWATRQASRRA